MAHGVRGNREFIFYRGWNLPSFALRVDKTSCDQMRLSFAYRGKNQLLIQYDKHLSRRATFLVSGHDLTIPDDAVQEQVDSLYAIGI